MVRAYSLEQHNAGRAHAGLCHASSFGSTDHTPYCSHKQGNCRYQTLPALYKSIGSAVFAQRTYYFTMCCYVFPEKLPLSLGIGSPSNTWYLMPIRVINPYDISIGPAVFVLVPNAMLYIALSVGKTVK